MSPKLERKLKKKYPKIFTPPPENGTIATQNPFHSWGFECGDGWYWIIDQLCAYIQGYLDTNPHLKIPQVECEQIKEKYGSLTFYHRGGSEVIRGMVQFAQYLSYSICEHCGSIENIGHSKGWIVTLCKDCASTQKLNWKLDKKN